MSKKLTGNGLFESSRMMLPEHKEAYIAHQRRLEQKKRPLLDEQKLEEISSFIQDSYKHHIAVKITVFDQYEERQYVGVVTHLDPILKKLKLRHEQKEVEINYAFITDVS